MERTKVMFFIYRMGGGGAARTVLNIVNHLDRQKFEPILVTLDFTYDYEEYVKQDVVFIKLNTDRLRNSIIPLARLVRQIRPDILFSTVITYNIIAVLSKLLSFTKTKVVLREAAFLGGKPKEDKKVKRAGKLYHFSATVIALSEGVKENLINRYGVSKDKIEVIYNPVDIEHIQQEMQHSIYYPVNKQVKTIVTAGRLVKEKDQLTLIKAIAIVNKQTPCELLILGEGELQGELKQAVKEYQLDNKVYFLGFQKNPYAYFYQADVFALSSTTEGFGHVLVEAMATNTLIVSTDCRPGAREVLKNGVYGYLAEVGDANDLAYKILEALTLPEEMKEKQIALGEKRVQEFAAPRIVSRYEEVFRKTLKK